MAGFISDKRHSTHLYHQDRLVIPGIPDNDYICFRGFFHVIQPELGAESAFPAPYDKTNYT